jgi:Mg2+-importing ATPase
VTLHLTEEREFISLVERCQPAWLLLAFVLQATTYALQSRLWQVALSPARIRLPMKAAYSLSLAKLFVDQALPSVGVSGNLFLVRALVGRGISRGLAMSVVAVDTASFYTAYAAGLALALLVLFRAMEITPVLLGSAAVLFGLASAVVAGVFAISGRPSAPAVTPQRRMTGIERAIELFREADPGVVRNRSVVTQGIGYHLTVAAIDAMTLWALLASVGTPARFEMVFAAFMVASLFRSIGVMPGGMGTFEASAVAALRVVGVPLAGALAGTLLFRGLSFWLPMIPGLVLSRHMNGSKPRPAEAADERS